MDLFWNFILWNQHFFRQIILSTTHVKRDHEFYGKINIFSVKSTILLKNSTRNWFHEKFKFKQKSHSVWKLQNFSLNISEEKFREINLFT